MTQRIILHVGLPKTGTSALQKWCLTTFHPNSNYNIEYAFVDQDHKLIPKHQFIVNDLMTGKYVKTKSLLTKLSKKKTSILSTEGLTNHFYDFSPTSLKHFRKLLSAYSVDIFIVFRNTEEWIKSYYKQCVINPPIACFNYATPLHLKEFSKLERIQKLIMRRSVETDVAESFGARNLVSASYDNDWASVFLSMLELDQKIKFNYPSVNTSIKDHLTEFIRQINNFNFDHDVREIWLGLLQHAFKTNSTLLQLYEKQIDNKKMLDRINLKYLDRIEQEGELNHEMINLIKEKLLMAYHSSNQDILNTGVDRSNVQ